MAWFKKQSPAEPVEKTATAKAAEEMVRFEAQDTVPRDPRDRPKGKPITGGIIEQLTKHADRNRELREREESGRS